MKPVKNQLCHLMFADILEEGRVQEVFDDYFIVKFRYGRWRVDFEGKVVADSFDRTVDLVFKNGSPVMKKRFLVF